MNNPEQTQIDTPSIPEQTPDLDTTLADVEHMLGVEYAQLSPDQAQLIGGLAIEAANQKEILFAVPRTKIADEYFESHEQ